MDVHWSPRGFVKLQAQAEAAAKAKAGARPWWLRLSRSKGMEDPAARENLWLGRWDKLRFRHKDCWEKLTQKKSKNDDLESFLKRSTVISVNERRVGFI